MLPKLIERIRHAVPESAPINAQDLKKAIADMSDYRRPVMIGLGLLGAFLATFILWAFFAPLDEGVPAPATIAVEGKRKVVQHLTGGIIRKIHVKESQEVNAGDPLIELDDTATKANFDASREQYYALQAQADRLHAEMSQAPSVSFSTGLPDAADDPLAAENRAIQGQLFVTRRQALQGELAILSANARSAEEQIVGLKAQARGKKEQLKFVLEQLEGSRALAREGYLPRTRWLEEERRAAELQAASDELESSVQRAESMAGEARQRLAQRQRDFQKEVETQYADFRRDAMVAAERLRTAREDFSRSVIRAPVAGYVNGLSALTEGSVVSPAVSLMDIVPKDEALILETRIDPTVIDRVHPGLRIDIGLRAFADDPNLFIEGVLESVSADLIAEPDAKLPPYYLGRVRVTPAGLRRLGARTLQPGMPAQVTIITGERTLVAYMLKPLLMRLSASLTEH